MKKQMYNGPKGGAPKIGDKKSSKGFGPSEASGNKRVQGIAKHKGEDGPSEMKASNPMGPHHKGVKGPNEMRDSKGSPGESPAKLPMDAKDSMHGYLGKFADDDCLRRGFGSLEKISQPGEMERGDGSSGKANKSPEREAEE